MKKLLVLGMTLFLGSGIAFAQKNEKQDRAKSIEIGTGLPAATVKTKATDGKDYTLEGAMTSKGLIVMFSCNTCPYVIKAQERTRETIELAKEKGIGIVIVNSNVAQRTGADSPEEMKKYGSENHPDAPYLIDNGPLVQAFGATRTPEVFLFDGKTKNLVYKGAMEDNPADPASSTEFYLEDAIENMLAGNEIDPNTTKSVGCTIKL